MDLLDFARGPALYFALAVFSLGTLWRRPPGRLNRRAMGALEHPPLGLAGHYPYRE
jgi:hypothetical protein